MKTLTLFVFLAGLWSVPARILGQAVDCPEADKYYQDIVELNKDWEVKRKELRAGLFCSKCERSKTEIERTFGIQFSEHLENVSGKPVPASQAVMDRAYAAYMDEYEQLVSDRMRAVKACEDTHQKKLAEEAAEKKKEEEERQAKAEADRLAREAAAMAAEEAAARKEQEEAERKAREEEERRAREEADRLAREQAEEEKRAFIESETERLAASSESRQDAYGRLMDSAAENLSRLADRVIGKAGEVRSAARSLLAEGYSSVSAYIMENSLDEELAEAIDYEGYARDWRSRDNIDDLIDFPAVKRTLRFGQEEDIRLIKKTLSETMDEFPDLFKRTVHDMLDRDTPGDILDQWDSLTDGVRQGICGRIRILNLCAK